MVLSLPSILHAQIKWDVSEKEIITLTEMDKAIHNGKYGEVHSVLVIKDNSKVFEEYYNGWARDSLQQMQSATKSIVSTLLGAAIQNDFVNSVDELIKEYYKDEYNLVNDTLKKKISIANLLTQRHGLDWKESPWNSPDNNWRKVLESQGDWYSMILKTPMDTLPGVKFNYSNAAPVLVTGLIQKASGLPINEFAKKYLFDPLAITDIKYWDGNGGPHRNGLALLYLKPRDMAKIGQLYLQNGQWNNDQVLPRNYVEEAISSKVVNAESNPLYRSYDYGYFWWVNPKIREKDAGNSRDSFSYFLARGAGGQNIIVWPKEKLIVVITAWNLSQPNMVQRIFDDFIVPKIMSLE